MTTTTTSPSRSADSNRSAAPAVDTPPTADATADIRTGSPPDATADVGAGSPPDATADIHAGSPPDATVDVSAGLHPDATADVGAGSPPDATADISAGSPPDATTDTSAAELLDRLFGGALGALDLLTAHVGLRLGLYQALADHPGVTPVELAQHSGIAPRYAREWLEQQTVTGMISCDDRTAADDDRTYRLPEGHRVALLDAEHPAYCGAIPLALAGISGALPQLLDAYRSGSGVPYVAYGADFRDGQAGFNRPAFTAHLANDWLTHFPDLHRRLVAGDAVRVADIACGAGWAAISIARAFPNAVVAGYDLDDASIADARHNAIEAGVADRVEFEVRDGADLPDGSFDLVAIFEAVHDLSRPVEVLAELRRLRAAGGHVLVMDERAADSFAESDGPIEAFLYGCSVLHCLPVGLAEQPSVGTGTVMRTATLETYASDAGFARVDVLPIEHDLFRFYELV